MSTKLTAGSRQAAFLTANLYTSFNFSSIYHIYQNDHRKESRKLIKGTKKKTLLEFGAHGHVSKKTERLNQSPPFVDVTDSNVDVRDTFDTVDSVDSFMV